MGTLTLYPGVIIKFRTRTKPKRTERVITMFLLFFVPPVNGVGESEHTTDLHQRHDTHSSRVIPSESIHLVRAPDFENNSFHFEKKNNTVNKMSDNENLKAAMDALNMACTKKTYQSFKNLQPGEYIVHQFSIVDTAHGKRVRIDLLESYMLLPERFIHQLGPEKISVLNKAQKIMVYGGEDSSDRDRLILGFRSDAYYAEMFNFAME